MFGRKLVVAGITAFALTPGVALACMGSGNGGASGSHRSIGATGMTGATGATGSTGSRGAAYASYGSNGGPRIAVVHVLGVRPARTEAVSTSGLDRWPPAPARALTLP